MPLKVDRERKSKGRSVPVVGRDGGDHIKFFIDTQAPYVSIKESVKRLCQGGGGQVDVTGLGKGVKQLVFNLLSRYSYRFQKHINKNVGVAGKLSIYDGAGGLGALARRDVYVSLVKDLINEPANIATPEYVCRWAEEVFAGVPHTSVTVLDEDGIRREGLGLVEAVGKGSSKPPRFLVVDYAPPRAKRTFCLCGKGVVFDAGGTQAKTDKANSYAMKCDKTGGCVALGVVLCLAKEGDARGCRLVAIVPLVENVVSGTATMPGDIVKSHSGKTVEILNTDAEGRLILADAMSYSERFRPDYVFDFATLTSSASKMHCDTATIFFAAGENLHRMVEEVGEEVGERAWGMPRWLEYMRYCRSTVADLKNYDLDVDGCDKGDAFMAAMFLAHFVPRACLRERWVHFDLVNTIDGHVMNANGMILAIELIKKLAKKMASDK